MLIDLKKLKLDLWFSIIKVHNYNFQINSPKHNEKKVRMTDKLRQRPVSHVK